MTKKESKTFVHAWRYVIGFALIVLLWYGTIRLVAPYIFSFGFPFYIYMLFFLLLISPSTVLSIYIAIWMVSFPTKETRTTHLRKWAVVYALGVSYILSFALIALLFEILTPNLPIFYRNIVLPQLVITIILLVLTRTRMKPRIEQFLKHLFRDSSDES